MIVVVVFSPWRPEHNIRISVERNAPEYDGYIAGIIVPVS